MHSRRNFLKQGLSVGLASVLADPLTGCAQMSRPSSARSTEAASQSGSGDAHDNVRSHELQPPPDLFDAQTLDLEFWLKPRVLDVTRPASGERAKLLYWKDGEIVPAAYQELCHLLRDVSAKQTLAIDPKLLETLWGTQAFVARYGMRHPLEILSGYRTPQTNKKLIEEGVPAARQSLHIQGKAADIRIANLNSEVLGGLVRSFRQGGVGFYYRPGERGGWIHADTGLQRVWKG